MKKGSLLYVCFCCSLLTVAQDSALVFSYFNGNGEDGLHLAWSEDGKKWEALNNDQSFLTPVVSTDRLMRDPCIIRGGDGDFQMVWTVSWKARSIGYAHSSDLIHWSNQQEIPVMANEPTARNCWAPEIFYDASSDQYMMYWASTIPGRFVMGDSSGDDAYNHRIYYTLTSDFTHFSNTRLLYDPGFNVIDATIQFINNRYVMWLKDETRYPSAKNIKLAFSDTLTGPYGQAGKPVTGDYWAEGPTVVYWKDRYWLYFDKYTQHQYGLLVTDDLEQWRDISEQLQMPDGIRHGTVLRVSRQELDKLKAIH